MKGPKMKGSRCGSAELKAGADVTVPGAERFESAGEFFNVMFMNFLKTLTGQLWIMKKLRYLCILCVSESLGVRE